MLHNPPCKLLQTPQTPERSRTQPYRAVAWSALLLLINVILGAHPVLASSAKARINKLYRRAKQAARRNDHRGAAALLQEVHSTLRKLHQGAKHTRDKRRFRLGLLRVHFALAVTCERAKDWHSAHHYFARCQGAPFAHHLVQKARTRIARMQQRLAASIHITSRPSGARFVLHAPRQKPLQGTTPSSVRLLPGAWQLTLSMPQHQTIQKQLQVIVRDRSRFSFVLPRRRQKRATLSLRTQTPQVSWRLNPTTQIAKTLDGKAPSTSSLAPGIWNLQLQHPRFGRLQRAIRLQPQKRLQCLISTQTSKPPALKPQTRLTLAWISVGLAVALGATGGALLALSRQETTAFEQKYGNPAYSVGEVLQHRNAIGTFQTSGIIALSLAGTAAISAIVFFTLPSAPTQPPRLLLHCTP